MESTRSRLSVRELVFCALFAVLIAVCSWISIPAPVGVPFTLQTFAVFVTLLLLGGKRGTAAVAVYLLLGAVGVPVFSGFRGGLGALLGVTGGYIVGFLLMALLFWALEALLLRADGPRGSDRGRLALRVVFCVLGLALCYAFGTAWFMLLYTRGGKEITLLSALGMCVLPYLIPDALKLALAVILERRLGKYL